MFCKFCEYQLKTIPILEKILVPSNGATGSMELDSIDLLERN